VALYARPIAGLHLVGTKDFIFSGKHEVAAKKVQSEGKKAKAAAEIDPKARRLIAASEVSVPAQTVVFVGANTRSRRRDAVQQPNVSEKVNERRGSRGNYAMFKYTYVHFTD
jgi:hypothetical protein